MREKLQQRVGKKTIDQNLLETIYFFRGKTSVNANCPARTKEETSRHHAPCKATARYCFNCYDVICGGLVRLDFCGLVAHRMRST